MRDLSKHNISKRHKSTDTEEEIDIRRIVHNYLQYWKWFILSGIIVLGLGISTYFTLGQKYEVSSQILLKEDKSDSPLGNPLGGLQELGLMGKTNNLDNEIAVLGSPNLVKKVVNTLNLHTQYYKKGFLRNSEVYDASPYIVSLPDIDVNNLKGSLELNIEPNKNGGVNISGEYRIKKEKYKIKGEITTLPGCLNFETVDGIGCIRVENRVVELEEEDLEADYKVVIINPTIMSYNIVQNGLTIVSTTKTSSVLDLVFETQNIKKGADFLTELIRQYNRNNVSDHNEVAVATSKFIDERLITIHKELEDVESEAERYKKQHKIAGIGTEAEIFVERTSEIEARRMGLEAQLRTLAMVEEFVKNPENKDKIIPVVGISEQGLASLVGEYNGAVHGYKRLERSTSETHPTRIRALTQIESLRDDIILSLENQKQAIRVSMKSVNVQIAEVGSQITTLPTKQKELLEIMRQQGIKQSLYLFLMKTREETHISMASTSDKAKVITDPIIPGSQKSPKLSIVMLASMLLAGALPIGVIYIRDLMENRITSREELESMIQPAVIGEISKKEGNEIIVVSSNATTPIAELFRALRNKVQFLANEEAKVMLVTSSIAGEGKTFVSANLAASYALLDKKILLIGADIRNPRVASDLDLRRGEGLTSYLVGDNTNWRSMLSRLNHMPNLDILQAGIIPPNPNELIMKDSFRVLIEEARAEYDLVILDSAPVGVISDTLLIGKYADITLYVTREGVTPKKATELINDIHHEESLPPLYVVINGVDLKQSKGRHGYGYGYGQK